MAKLALYRLMMGMIGSLLTIAAASQLQLKIEPVENEPAVAFDAFAFKKTFKTKQELGGYLQNIPAMLQAKGYLSASVDSISERNNTTTAYLFLGAQYRWKELRVNPADRPLLEELGYYVDVSGIAGTATIETMPRRIVEHYQDNGYPFAKVKWDNMRLSGGYIDADLTITPGPLYKMDSIGMHGVARLSKSFLLRYLDLPADGIYRQAVLDKVDRKLAELRFVEQERPWSITMQSTGYVLNFYLRPKKSNQVDALIGLLPSNTQNGGRLLLTVDAKLVLQNAFGAGELIDFNWEQIQPRSPRLHLVYKQPYVFRSSAGLDLSFQLYKKDSSFLNIIGNLGLQYRLGDHQSATVSLQLQRTNLLDIDTVTIKSTKRLPDVIDLGIGNINLAYAFVNTNYRFNPRRGAELDVVLSAGRKTIRRNNTITGIKDPVVNYSRLYDSLRANSYQAKITLAGAYYLPLARQSVLKTALQAGVLQTVDYFRNEMFQLGGARLLRGFDEESIFADRYTVATLEYRYLVNLNSYFFGFADAGWSHFRSRQTSFGHTYAGLGAGMAFQVKQGIFNISYAVGKRDDTRFDLRQSKLHFGYTSFF